MADTFTTNLNLTKPEPGAAEDTWGISLNADLDALDAIFSTSGTQINLNPNQVNFADNKKAVFGAGSDLQIYHDGSNSFIQDAGTGTLRILSDDVRIMNAAGTEISAQFLQDGEARLKYDNSTKLATKSTGIDVTGNATFDDNGYAIFGASNDLQIYHDGSNSYIRDIGTGNLNILADELKIMNAAGTENKAFFVSDGGAYLYHNNSAKLETTSTGIDVTGTATMDGLTVNSGTTNTVGTFTSTDSGAGIQLTDSTGSSKLETSGANLRVSVDDDNAVANSAIQFRVDGSTKATLNSSGNLGLGTSPSSNLHIKTSVDNSVAQGLIIERSANTDKGYINYNGGGFQVRSTVGDPIVFGDTSNEQMRLTSTGVGIGCSPSYPLEIQSGGVGTVLRAGTSFVSIDPTGSAAAPSLIFNGDANTGLYRPASDTLAISTSGSEALRIDNNQNVGIGTSSPTGDGTALHIHGSTHSTLHLTNSTTGSAVSDGFDIITDGSDALLRNREDAAIKFRIGSSEVLRMNSTGVGISTTSPRGTLDLGSGSGDGTLSNTPSDYQLILEAAQSTTGDIGRNIAFVNGTNNVSASINSYDAGTGVTNGLVFATAASGTLAERMRLDSSGRLGLGTSPTTPLHVYHATTDTVANFQSGDNSVAVNFTALDNSMQIATSNTDGILKNNGAGSLRFFNNGSEAARLDSSGQLLIGKTASDNTTVGTRINGSGFISSVVDGDNAVLLNRLNSDGSIVLFRKDGTSVGSINTVSDDLAILSSISGHKGLRFGSGAITPTTNTAAIDNGNTDLGGNSIRFKDLYLAGTANVGGLTVDGDATSAGTIGVVADGGTLSTGKDSSSTRTQIAMYNPTGQVAKFDTNSDDLLLNVADNFRIYTAASERLRLDASGNFYVGTTDTTLYSATSGGGIYAVPNGSTTIARQSTSSTQPLFILNETGVDGTLQEFRKDGSIIGSIGVAASDNFYIGASTSGHAGLYFDNGNMVPMSANLPADDAIDLGSSLVRFDDIYATNGTIQTSDINEKQDIEDLTDAETRVAVAAKGLLKKYRWKSAVEEKGDDARIHFGIMAQDLQNAFTAEGLDAGDYGMFISTTWTDDDGVEQTRLGVRYNELLAFIIAVI